MLPTIREAVGDTYPLIFDSGVRNGEGVVKALAMGADFVMMGRPFMYGIGADGKCGLDRVIKILQAEISLTLAQVGVPDIRNINDSVLLKVL